MGEATRNGERFFFGVCRVISWLRRWILSACLRFMGASWRTERQSDHSRTPTAHRGQERPRNTSGRRRMVDPLASELYSSLTPSMGTMT